MENKYLKKRIIEISYNQQLSHIGSCITAVDIIDDIYKLKKPDEKFVLSAGHAHLAHLVVMEKYQQGQIDIDAEFLLARYGIHCERKAGCDVSTGSLGQGLPISVGMALADRSKNVYCLISDGEYAEGSIHEAIDIIARLNIENLKVYVNWNGWAAYMQTEAVYKPAFLEAQGFKVYRPEINIFPFLIGQDAHYKILSEDDYKLAMEILK